MDILFLVVCICGLMNAATALHFYLKLRNARKENCRLFLCIDHLNTNTVNKTLFNDEIENFNALTKDLKTLISKHERNQNE